MTPNRVRGIIIRANEPHRQKLLRELHRAQRVVDAIKELHDRTPIPLVKHLCAARAIVACRRLNRAKEALAEAPGGYRCKS